MATVPATHGGGDVGADSGQSAERGELTSADPVSPSHAAEAEAPPFEAAVAAAIAPEADLPSTVRAGPDTVAALAAEVARKLDARVSRFDLTLTPEGLGEVVVSIEVGAAGEVSAQFNFERPEAAADLRARSAELRTALEQSGFTVSAGGLNFDSAGGRGQAPEPPVAPVRCGLFDDLDKLPEPVSATRPRVSRGLDVRI